MCPIARLGQGFTENQATIYSLIELVPALWLGHAESPGMYRQVGSPLVKTDIVSAWTGEAVATWDIARMAATKLELKKYIIQKIKSQQKKAAPMRDTGKNEDGEER